MCAPLVRETLATCLLLVEVALKSRERGFLAAAGRFPCRTDIGYMKISQVTEGVQTSDGRSVGGEPLIQLAGPISGRCPDALKSRSRSGLSV